jgi:plastocyanin
VTIVLAGGGVASAQMPDMPGMPGMGGGPGGAGDVSILATAFAPDRIDVVAGDTVHWDNVSVQRHTVTADDGSFGSGQLFGGDGYAHRFAAAGEVAYHCTVHPYMHGVVDIHRVLLDAPREPGAPGRPYVLSGRSSLPAGSAVAVERDAGSGFVQVASATVGADGGFTAAVRSPESASFRAVTADGEASPAVHLLIVDRSITAVAGRGVVRVAVTPASPGAVVVLQLRQREHFGWWPTRRMRLDRSSHAVFRVPVARRTRARAVLTLADGATILASSRVVTVAPRRR